MLKTSSLLVAFRDWAGAPIERVKVADPVEKAEVLGPHRRARDYWIAPVEKANAD
jgi:hypothetical protein